MFLVRHEPYQGAVWTAWLDSVNGLLPAAAVHEACCRGRGAVRHVVLQPSMVKASQRTPLCQQHLSRAMPAGHSSSMRALCCQ